MQETKHTTQPRLLDNFFIFLAILSFLAISCDKDSKAASKSPNNNDNNSPKNINQNLNLKDNTKQNPTHKKQISPKEAHKKFAKNLVSIVYKENDKTLQNLTGFFIDSSGIIATIIPKPNTNNDIEIIYGKNTYNAKLVALDSITRLGLIKIQPNQNQKKPELYSRLIDLDFADNNQTHHNYEEVFSFSFNPSNNWQCKPGRIIGKFNEINNNQLPIFMLRSNFNLSNKSYGSPVISSNGKIVGMAFFIDKNATWTIPGKAIKHCLDSFKKNGTIELAWFNAGLSSDNNLPIVSHINNESPIAKAGLKIGDIILKINQERINNIYDLMDAAYYLTPSTSCTFTILRGNKIIEAEVTPTTMPKK